MFITICYQNNLYVNFYVKQDLQAYGYA